MQNPDTNITNARHVFGRFQIVKEPPSHVYTDELFEIGVVIHLPSKDIDEDSRKHKVTKMFAELCDVSQQGMISPILFIVSGFTRVRIMLPVAMSILPFPDQYRL